MDPMGVALLGCWHVHAGDYAGSAQRNPGTRLVAVWDDDESRGREGADRFDAPFEASLDAVLARDDVDAVIVTTATTRHTEVIGAAIDAGKHVFTEKLLAPTTDEARELARRAEDAGVILGVSLPQLTGAPVLAARRLLADGVLGTPTYVRVRMGHDGWLSDWLPERFGDPAEAVGGALTDLGCHPAYLTRLFLGGDPATISASYGRFTHHRVEDNAVAVASYENGALGVFEATFVAVPGTLAFEIRGTAGSALYGFGDGLVVTTGEGEPRTIDLDSEDARSPFDLWADAARAGERMTENVQAAIDLTRTVTAANRSAASGKAEPLEP